MVEDRPRSTLGQVLDDLGLTLLDVALGTVDRSAPVRSVVIFDPTDPPHCVPGDLVLGVGLVDDDDIVAAVKELARARGVGLILKLPFEPGPQVRELVEDNGLVLLGVTRGASWSQVAAMLNSSLGLRPDDGALSSVSDIDDRGDLFALANAIAGLLNAPVTIEDLNSRVLAFSADQATSDEYRKNSVLGRQVPENITRDLKRTGFFDQVYSSSRPVLMEPSLIGLGPGGMTRAVIAIRAGNEILGTIWVVLSGPLKPEHEQALIDVTRPAALHILRSRIALRGQERIRAEVVDTILSGGRPARDLATKMGQFAGAACVVAAGIRPWNADLAQIEVDMQRLTSAFQLHVSVMHPHAATAPLGSTVYAILPLGDIAPDRAAAQPVIESMRAFLSRVSERIEVVIGVGRVVRGPLQLASSRDDADRALRVARESAVTSSETRVASIDDVQVDALLLQLGDIIAAENLTAPGAIARLSAYDLANSAELISTLRHWLDAFGDVPIAAARLFVHPNTLRYRLKRIAAVAEVDLDDPEARFGLMLQLRLFVPRS